MIVFFMQTKSKIRNLVEFLEDLAPYMVGKRIQFLLKHSTRGSHNRTYLFLTSIISSTLMMRIDLVNNFLILDEEIIKLT